MSRHPTLANHPLRFTLCELLLAMAYAAIALTLWYYLSWLSMVTSPLWTGLAAAHLSRRQGWEFAWVFVVWFWCGFIVLLLWLCIATLIVPFNEAL